MKDPGTSGRLPTAVASEPHVVASPHLAPLDGLRALAIGLVLLYHLTPGHESDLGLRALPFKIADLGWSGVDLFFVLSGFLITGKLIEARSEAEPFRNFYARRALRIFPLYYLALLVTLFALPAMSGRFEVPSAADQLPFWLYYSNFQMPRIDFGGLTSLGHFWSLAVEEQFYLLWPAIVLRGSLSRTRQVCVAVFALAPLARLAALLGGAAWQVTFQWTPLRGDGLVVGATLALLWRLPGWRAALCKWSVPVGLATGAVLAWVAWTHRAGLVFKGQASLETIAARVLLPTLLAVFFGSLLVLALEWRPLARA
ncbi:MAG: acyltransferase, partial [Thermoanaerobaculia bacterium]|nr:acyltransferase [Thermoanaerobaculia bacterium]